MRPCVPVCIHYLQRMQGKITQFAVLNMCSRCFVMFVGRTKDLFPVCFWCALPNLRGFSFVFNVLVERPRAPYGYSSVLYAHLTRVLSSFRGKGNALRATASRFILELAQD